MRARVIAVALLLAAVARAGDESSWLPAREGWKWTYEVRKVAKVGGVVSAKKKGTVTCVCKGAEKVGDKECAVLEWSSEGDERVRVKVWVQAGESSVSVLRASGRDLVVVPAEAKEKKRVKVEVATDDEKVSVESETLATEEEVTTPAGTYKCLKVSATCSTAGAVTAKRTVWYAKGVGVVKIAKGVDVGGGVSAEREIVLAKLEKGEKK